MEAEEGTILFSETLIGKDGALCCLPNVGSTKSPVSVVGESKLHWFGTVHGRWPVCPPGSASPNAAAVREAPRTGRGFRFFRMDIVGVRQTAAAVAGQLSMGRSGQNKRPPGFSPSSGKGGSRSSSRANASSSTPRLDANNHSHARPPIRAVTAQIPAKQRGFSALRFSDPGLPPRRCPRPFAASPESCQAKSEPYGARAACPLAAGLDLPPPSNSEHGCDICLRRSSAANHLASIISKHQIIATVSAIPGPLASR